jgi:phosphonoacetate hydrolase
VVVVCVDGCEPDYVTRAVAAGRGAWLGGVVATQTSHVVDAVVPSFTNPNNLSIVTACRPRCTASAATTSAIRDAARR